VNNGPGEEVQIRGNEKTKFVGEGGEKQN